MSTHYQAVQWSPHKKLYDVVLVGAIVAFLIVFAAVSVVLRPGDRQLSPPILLLRGTGVCAIVLLHVILCIGPLARLDRRFLPILYNRRHLGVTMFLIALVHAGLSLGFYHGFGRINPLESLLTSNTQFRSISAFPFELFGVAALLILFVMAATSHDFWLKNLSPGVWKTLHMFVYVAWAFLILHVALGALQTERNPVYPILLGGGIVIVSGLHILAGWRERRVDRSLRLSEWVDVCHVDEIADTRAKVVTLSDERVAIFRYDGKLSAVSNVCAHQAGPIGEGKIIDGCITCPWHGYQYQPGDGCSPPPFTEKLPTYQVRVQAGRVLIDPAPLAPGTAVKPALVNGDNA